MEWRKSGDVPFYEDNVSIFVMFRIFASRGREYPFGHSRPLLAGTPGPVKRTLRCGLDCGIPPWFMPKIILRHGNMMDFLTAEESRGIEIVASDLRKLF